MVRESRKVIRASWIVNFKNEGEEQLKIYGPGFKFGEMKHTFTSPHIWCRLWRERESEIDLIGIMRCYN